VDEGAGAACPSVLWDRMDKAQLLERLMVTFLDELEEHVQTLNQTLRAIDQDPEPSDDTLVATLFRTVHSLKGAARSVRVGLIERACHGVETLLAAVRDRRHPLDAATRRLIFTLADALKDAGQRLRAHQPLSDAPLAVLIPQIDAIARGWTADTAAAPDGTTGDGAAALDRPPPAEAPSMPAEAGMDVVRVRLHKLDELTARSRELLVARHRMVSRLDEVERLLDSVRRQRARWQRLGPLLRTFTRESRHNRPTAGASLSGARFRHLASTLADIEDDLERLGQSLEALAAQMAADHHALEQAAAPLGEALLGIRMMPFGEACLPIERAVYDLAQAASKQIAVRVDGSDVEIDRAILDRLRDPLLHLVRNAVDHGIETPEERRIAAKAPRATLTLAAAVRGSAVEISVSDDGRGVDVAAVRERARLTQLPVPADAREAIQLLFRPGFSTAKFVTELSGRGIGLDIVRHAVEALHGYVDFGSTPGEGSRVTLVVPLTLATIRVLLLGVQGHVFALPVTSVVRLARVRPADVGSAAGLHVLRSDDGPLPIAMLSDVLGMPPARQEAHRSVSLVVVAAGQRRVALVVDDLLAERDVVVQSLGPRLARVRHFAGATILPTGDVALILNAPEVVHSVLGRAPGSERPVVPAPRRDVKRRLLLVEDSVTTRTLEKSILEAAGYHVTAAADGDEAWRLLQQHGADLVIADIEMPRMDGLTLCETIRRSLRFRDLPVVLVTARENDADKARGLEAGANAYLPKSTFDQRQLLETIAQLL
jgi:two-component system chemotaxis sensor kinase CheA